jgi:hypothetical protein
MAGPCLACLATFLFLAAWSPRTFFCVSGRFLRSAHVQVMRPQSFIVSWSDTGWTNRMAEIAAKL